MARDTDRTVGHDAAPTAREADLGPTGRPVRTRGANGTPTSAQLQAAADTFTLLSTPIRLHLVWLLVQQDRDVGSLAAEVGATVAAVSQHLAKLRLAGLVSAHRDGRRQVYTVDDPHVIALLDQIFKHIAPDGSLTPNW
jgi:DNA-binding transcriptional ArsR family regulator